MSQRTAKLLFIIFLYLLSLLAACGGTSAPIRSTPKPLPSKTLYIVTSAGIQALQANDGTPLWTFAKNDIWARMYTLLRLATVYTGLPRILSMLLIPILASNAGANLDNRRVIWSEETTCFILLLATCSIHWIVGRGITVASRYLYLLRYEDWSFTCSYTGDSLCR